MPIQLRGKFFGDIEKMLARALYDAGQTDREIADAIPTSVNNIIHWRKGEQLAEHAAPPRPADHVPWNAAGDIPGAKKADAIPTSVNNERVSTRAPAQRVECPGASPFPAPGHTISDPQPSANALAIGTGIGGRAIHVDLEELLTTRLLIQGNSGSGKSHLLRKLLEEATGIIQQIVIDPEGDFVSFEAFGHTIIDAGKEGVARLGKIAARVREHRASAVLNLEALDPDQQMEAVAVFLTGLFDAPQAHWYPALVAVDEAQLFAPTADNGEDRDSRRASLVAMTNLMCRGRKRGLAGIVATQRLAKLHKNVAAEASNFLMGRTFMDIDIKRAADMAGLSARDANEIRGLNRGEFIGLGPAIARSTTKVKVGAVITAGKSGSKGLIPLPEKTAEEMGSLILADDEDEAPAPALRVVK